MHRFPPGYFLTWGTYGTRLHGEDRPFVDMKHNVYRTPFPQPDPQRVAWNRDKLKFDPVVLSREQRLEVEHAITELTERYGWVVHALAAQSDHVHVVITADRMGDPLREALKAAASRVLNARYGKRPWWAEGGSDKHLYEPGYLENATGYVLRQRDW